VAATADEAIQLRRTVKDYAYGACATIPNPFKIAALPGKILELKLKVTELQARILQDGPLSLTSKFDDLIKKTDEFTFYAFQATLPGGCHKSKIDSTSKDLNDLLVFIRDEAAKDFLSSKPPQVITLAANNISSVSATLRGSVSPPAQNSAVYWFEWGENQNNLSKKTTEKTTGVVSSLNVSENISGLTAGKTYYFRVAARTEGKSKVAYGQILSFVAQSTSSQQFTLTVSKSGTGSGTVTSTPTGINCGTDCSESYASGTSVTLQATASAGSVFAGWSGDCSGTGTCTVTLNSNKSVSVTFNSSGGGGRPPGGDPGGGGDQPGPAGTYTLYLKLGHFQGGATFVEDRQLTATEKNQFKVEIWTQPTGPYDFGKKVAEGSLGSPISLSPGNYQASLQGSLPSPYSATRQVPSGCTSFSISSSQSTGVICTLEAYNKNDTSNYDLPSTQRPSGAPPMVEIDSSLGSYKFIKNVVDVSQMTQNSAGQKYPKESIVMVGFLDLYGKKTMLVLTRQVAEVTYNRVSYKYNLSIYDISSPFYPTLLKKNELGEGVPMFSNRTLDNFILANNHPFVYWPYWSGGNEPTKTYFLKINSDWTVSQHQQLNVKVGNSEKSGYWLQSLFEGLDGKIYGLALTPDEEKQYYPGCAPIAVLKFETNNSLPSKIAEINQLPHLGNKCGSGVAYNEWKSFSWRAAQAVRSGEKLYLLVPTDDVVARLHVVERAWISVFDFSNPTLPQFLGMNMLSGLNNQLHFPDASEAEKVKIYADAGLTEVDKATGYVYDIFPHMYDFQNAGYMTNAEAVNAFFNISGPWRYRNGIIVRKLNNSGNFDFLYRATLCETEGGRPSGGQGGHFHRVECGDQTEWWGQKTFDRAFYGIGNYITSLPSVGTHAYNGLVLLRDLTKSSIEESQGIRLGGSKIKMIAGSPAVVGLITSDNKLKIIPDSSDEFLKFVNSLSEIVTRYGGSDEYGKYLLDAHLQQVDDKTFAIFQIHPNSIDVVKLTLKDPRPLPSSSPSFTPQATTMTLTTASATPSTGTLSPIQGTLYSIRSVLNNLRRILSR